MVEERFKDKDTDGWSRLRASILTPEGGPSKLRLGGIFHHYLSGKEGPVEIESQ